MAAVSGYLPTFSANMQMHGTSFVQWQSSTEELTVQGIDVREDAVNVPCAPPCTRSPSPSPRGDTAFHQGALQANAGLSLNDLMAALRNAYAKELNAMDVDAPATA